MIRWQDRPKFYTPMGADTWESSTLEKRKEMALFSHFMKDTKVNGREIVNTGQGFTKIFQQGRSTRENTAKTNPTEMANSQNGTIPTADNSNQAKEPGREYR
jgi:hypothetical protein